MNDLPNSHEEEEDDALVEMICRHCQSRLVMRDGVLAWSVSKQDWVILAVTGSSYCADCEADDAIIEVEIE